MIIQHLLHFTPGSPAAVPVLFLIFSALFISFLLSRRRSSRLLLLCSACALLCVPVASVLAVEVDSHQALSEAIRNKADEIILTADITQESHYSFDNFTSSILDLNGNKLALGSGFATGNLTLRDSSSEKTGMITLRPGKNCNIDIPSGATFIMESGTISEFATHYGTVQVGNGSTFTMKGGTISGIKLVHNDYIGVYVKSGGTFNLSGGKITGNEGSDVYLESGTKITVTGKLSGTDRVGVRMAEPGVFTSGLSGNGDASNFFSNDPDYAVMIDETSGEAKLVAFQKISDWAQLAEAFQTGGAYKLDDDITWASGDPGLDIPKEKTVTLDLNGKTIDHGLTSPAGNGSVIRVDGNLTLTGSGTVTGGNAVDDGGGVAVFGGTFTMEGGTITGNAANRYHGGGVVVNGGTFTMKGGTINGNSAQYGGGIAVNGGTFSMEGGTISGNTTVGDHSHNGGGVYVDSGTFSMSGGTITGNNVPTDRDYGGGVAVYRGTFSLSGGKISGNWFNGIWDKDRQVYNQPYYPTDPDLGRSNVYLQGTVITVTGPLDTSGGPIGVSMDYPGVFTSGLKGSGDASSFRSEDFPGLSIRLNSRGEAVLAREAVSTPEITPPGGSFEEDQSVAITCATDGASIWYTTDGSDPVEGSDKSTAYTQTFTVSETATVKAIAVQRGRFDSEIASATYTITYPVEEPTYALSVTAPSFDTVTFGYAQPGAQPVIIRNTGTGDVDITDAELGGKGADSFILTGTPGITVEAGSADSRTFTVQPVGSLDAGTYTAEITVTYSGGSGSPADVSDFIEFTVEPKPLSAVTVALDPEGPFPYDGEEHSVTVVARDGEKLLTESVDYEIKEGSVTKATDTGTYEVIVEGVIVTESEEETPKALTEGNYSGTVTLTWQIRGTEPEPEPEPEPRSDRRRLFRFCEDCELPATGFSSVRPTALSEQPAALRYEPVRMRLMLPTLDEDVELVTLPREGNTWAAAWLGAGAGILEGSALPGKGTTVIAAHNTLNDTTYGPFAMLPSMEPGDRIFVTSEAGELLSFEVYANEKIAAADIEGLRLIASAYDNSLTLMTCEDEMPEGGYASRRIVAAKEK